MVQFKLWLTALYEAFRFIKRYRERQAVENERLAQERSKEREHQRLLIEAIASQLVAVVKANQEGLLEIAKSSAAQAEAFNTWLKSFQTSSEPEASRVIRDEDEWQMEQDRLRESDPETYVAQLPPEFQMAFVLNKLEQAKDPNPDFDREGRDIV